MVQRISGLNNKGIKNFKLATFFEAWWDEYVKHPAVPITPEQYKAVAAMRVCRTEALGGVSYPVKQG